MQSFDTDILIIGAGEAGLSAALRARTARPDLNVTIVTRGPGQKSDVRGLDRHRALDVVPAADRSGLAGALTLDMQSGDPVLIRARAALLATGREPDGFAMALRAGLPLRDMEAGETGGVQTASDGSTGMRWLYAAGDVTSGRVPGAVVGESMTKTLRRDDPLVQPDAERLEAAVDRALSPFRRRRSDLPSVRKRLDEIMAHEMGASRTLESLGRARHALNNLASGISGMGVPDPEPRNNGVWMERLDLENLVLMTRAICGAMQARLTDADPRRFTVVRANDDERIDLTTEPGEFTA